jgi:hypothetical protein
LHETTKWNIERMDEKYRIAGSKDRKEIKLEPSDLVWLHLQKDCFPELRKSKLMSGAVGPFKVLEVPADFGVSPMFNISDLHPYLGEEDEMSSMMTPIQRGEDDEDVYTHDDSPVTIQGPITRAHAHQLQYQVKSFLSSTPCQLQDRLLPNEILIVRNEGQAYEGLKNHLGGAQMSRRCWTRDGASTTRWRPTQRWMRVLLGFQDQCTFKLKLRMHTNSDFDPLYMDGKKMTRPFQCHQSQLQIRPESSEVNETSQSPKTASMLRHRIGPLGLAPS